MIELQTYLDNRLGKLNRGEIPKAQILKDLRESGLIDKKGNVLKLTRNVSL